MALLIGFHVSYVPFHLATEAHLDDLLASLGVEQSYKECGLEANDGHGDNHLAHLAADHSIQLTLQTVSCFVALDLVAVDTRVPQPQSQPCFRLFLTERQNPPGKIALGPSQPRAPPLA
ncbi:MAG: hypothetical protein HY736_12715 [Verrucomicrobia bacterium]|nr:hypothetical protein [Verrucomicrobiota bacterium]